MALTTEFVAKADEYQTIIQTVNTSSTLIYIPDGVWMCSLTARAPIPEVYGSSWINLDGKRADIQTVDVVSEVGGSRYADIGVVVPSFTGGRNISITSSARRDLQFYAAKIGH